MGPGRASSPASNGCATSTPTSASTASPTTCSGSSSTPTRPARGTGKAAPSACSATAAASFRASPRSPSSFRSRASSIRCACNRPPATTTPPICCAAGGQLGEMGLGTGHLPRSDRQHHVHRLLHREHPAFLRRDQRIRLRSRRCGSVCAHRDVLCRWARCEQSCCDEHARSSIAALVNNFTDDVHRPALPYKFKFKVSGCPNDCMNSIERSDFAVIGTWRDDMKVDQAGVAEYVAKGPPVSSSTTSSRAARPTHSVAHRRRSAVRWTTATACAACTASTSCRRRCQPG